MTHPEADVLLRFAEGEDVLRETAAHVGGCARCQEQLGDVAAIETQLAAASELTGEQRASLRAAARRVLAAKRDRRRSRWRTGAVIGLLAAAWLATLLLWPRAQGLCEIGVRRYEPDHVVRSERLERFALDVRVDQPRWLSLWRLDAQGAQRLMPHNDPLLRWLGAEMPLGAGVHRVPAAEVLDFEFAAASAPAALLLVASNTEPTSTELAAIEALIAAEPRARLEAAVQAKWPEARVLAFPAK